MTEWMKRASLLNIPLTIGELLQRSQHFASTLVEEAEVIDDDSINEESSDEEEVVITTSPSSSSSNEEDEDFEAFEKEAGKKPVRKLIIKSNKQKKIENVTKKRKRYFSDVPELSSDEEGEERVTPPKKAQKVLQPTITSYLSPTSSKRASTNIDLNETISDSDDGEPLQKEMRQTVTRFQKKEKLAIGPRSKKSDGKYKVLANEWIFDEEDTEYLVDYTFPLDCNTYEKLYQYQREGVKWLAESHLRLSMNGGILADDMGLGKTIQVSSFIQGLFLGKLGSRVLIIAPVSVLETWNKEINTWVTSKGKVFMFYKLSESQREETLNNFEKIAKSKGCILLSTYGMINTHIEQLSGKFKEVLFDLIVCDEGHKIKNPKAAISTNLRKINAKTKIVLTGTPIMNRLGEMWALYDYIFDGKLLHSYSQFKNDYERDIVAGTKRDASLQMKIQGNQKSLALRDVIKNYFLRREKHQVLKTVTEGDKLEEESSQGKGKFIATITQKNDLILWVFLTGSQEKIYRQYLASKEVQSVLTFRENVLSALTSLKQVCCHPVLVKKPEEKQEKQPTTPAILNPNTVDTLSSDNEIEILDSDDDSLSELPNQVEVEQVASEEEEIHWRKLPIDTLIEGSGKLVVMCKLLKELKRTGHRTLIFSQYARMLDIFERVLKEKLRMSYLRIDGTVSSAKERQTRVDAFNDDNRIDCFILTSQVGGIGLTLTGADRIIIFDPNWNPAIDNQSVDRAYRIGQKRNVVVYRLITCATIEESVYKKQIFKDGIAKTATNKENQYRYFNTSELEELFTLDNPRVSKTQKQLSKLHAERKSYPDLDKHLDVITKWEELYGVSDHDLLFNKEADDDLSAAIAEQTYENTVVMRPSLEYQIQQNQEKFQLYNQQALFSYRAHLQQNHVIDATNPITNPISQPITKPQQIPMTGQLGPYQNPRPRYLQNSSDSGIIRNDQSAYSSSTGSFASAYDQFNMQNNFRLTGLGRPGFQFAPPQPPSQIQPQPQQPYPTQLNPQIIHQPSTYYQHQPILQQQQPQQTHQTHQPHQPHQPLPQTQRPDPSDFEVIVLED